MNVAVKFTLGTAAVIGALLVWRKKLNMDVNDSLIHPNMQAFLMAIRYGEGTAAANGYHIVYGGGLFHNMSDHPTITGEWKGKQLPDHYCKGAGLNPPCFSTAAGAYQFLRPTWKKLKLLLQLPDFSPDSQDLAAIELIREKGALQDVIDGRIDEAIRKVKPVWASIPGATYGQPTASLSAWKNVYLNSGGQMA